MKNPQQTNLGDAGLERDAFLADMVANLVETTEEVLGFEDASSFVANVGDRIGCEVSRAYLAQAGPIDAVQDYVAAACVDLKKRLHGEFAAVEVTEDEIVFENTRCPFAERVVGKPALCMMTTNVFGRVAADANGYARVHIEDAIATGQKTCRVRVHLKAEQGGCGHEFYR